MRSEEAVSPLIATVLLIAIAVALGAIVLSISQNLAENSIPDPPPSTAFTVKDHPWRMDSAADMDSQDDPRLDPGQCADWLMSVTVDEDIRLRDYTIRIGQDDALFDVWGENATTVGNINRTFQVWVDAFPAGPGGPDYALDPATTLHDKDGDDLIKAGTSFVIREIFHNPLDDTLPGDEEKKWNGPCLYFGFGDQVQLRLVYATGDILKDVTLKLQ